MTDPAADREADQFAYGFLMPESEFRAAWVELHGNPSAVAGRFGVTREHALARAAMLELESDPTPAAVVALRDECDRALGGEP